MTYRTPSEARQVWRRRVRLAVLLLGIGVVTLWADRPVYLLMAGDESTLERNDWYQMFRAVGFLPTWLLVAGSVALVEWRNRAERVTGLAILLSAACSGLAAELLKVVLGRHRPDENGHLLWNPLFGAIYDPDRYGSSLGLPSSHAAVAFGGAIAVALIYPGARWPALLAAAGCAITRLLAGAHALSDVYAAVIVAWAVAWLCVRGVVEDRESFWIRPG